MNNKKLLNKAKKIHIHLDSNTFENLLLNSDKLAHAILRYHNSNCLEFVRSSFKTIHEELLPIVEYKLIKDDNSEIKSIDVDCGTHSTKMAFYYNKSHILSTAQKILQKEEINQEELENITSVFVQAVFNDQEAGINNSLFFDGFEKLNIYITNDNILLKNRLWFESHYPGYTLNIMSVEEASIFIDLFFKKNGKYCFSCRSSLNKGGWYWHSMRLKLPHYNVGNPMIDALAFRLNYLLMSLDEISIQFYSGVNNDTMDNTLYHFNYLISLMTGIFDNLALTTNSYLGINCPYQNRISLSNKSGRDFLRKIRDENPIIRKHINDYATFIQLIYSFRELVIHREGLSKTGFSYKDKEIEWEANFIKISEKSKQRIENCGDSINEYEPLTEWGIYENNNEIYLEPYHFSKQAVFKLIKFSDKYLELLEYPSYVEKQKTQPTSDFAKTLINFEKFHLGF